MVNYLFTKEAIFNSGSGGELRTFLLKNKNEVKNYLDDYHVLHVTIFSHELNKIFEHLFHSLLNTKNHAFEVLINMRTLKKEVIDPVLAGEYEKEYN